MVEETWKRDGVYIKAFTTIFVAAAAVGGHPLMSFEFTHPTQQ